MSLGEGEGRRGREEGTICLAFHQVLRACGYEHSQGGATSTLCRCPESIPPTLAVETIAQKLNHLRRHVTTRQTRYIRRSRMPQQRVMQHWVLLRTLRLTLFLRC